MDAQVSLVEVEAALCRCLIEHPPEGRACRLCSDACLLADVFGEMTYWRESARPLKTLTELQREAFERWSLQTKE